MIGERGRKSKHPRSVMKGHDADGVNHFANEGGGSLRTMKTSNRNDIALILAALVIVIN